ncbi:transposase domain protein [Mycobacterium xenopi 4042]|uniref:Transposase domain protein n=1 Tax=Mycobacterium xenopi 4042 TaxID=1299334 RepID=X8DCP5_MYCXE|nr:transposase domain protein [Mycobacterium xenopi 4042]
MIIGLRTRAHAAKVAAATAGVHLAGKSKPDGTPALSRFVDVGRTSRRIGWRWSRCRCCSICSTGTPIVTLPPDQGVRSCLLGGR